MLVKWLVHTKHLQFTLKKAKVHIIDSLNSIENFGVIDYSSLWILLDGLATEEVNVAIHVLSINPVRANMRKASSGYICSSYHCKALGKQSRLCTAQPLYLLLEYLQEIQVVYRALLTHQMANRLLEEIRASIKRGVAFGRVKFNLTPFINPIYYLQAHFRSALKSAS